MAVGGSGLARVTEIGATLSSGKRWRGRNGCGPALTLVRRPAQALRLGSAALPFQPSLAGGRARLCRNATPLDLEGLAKLLDEPLDRELTVAHLAALVLSDGPQHRPGARQDSALLCGREHLRGLDVEDRLDACLRLLRVLSTWPA